MTLEWQSQPGAHGCFKGHLKPPKLQVKFSEHFLGSRSVTFLIGFAKGYVTPTNVKNICIIVLGGLGQMDSKASCGVA